MKYDFILYHLDVPQWLIDNLNDLDESNFLRWLEKNIPRLIEINSEFQDMAAELIHLNHYHDDIPDPPYCINDDWFPDAFEF